MKLFGKKKTEKVEVEKVLNGEGCFAKVLGTGCSKCNTLSENVKQALTELEKDPCIEKVTDFADIAKFGVMSTPALVLGDKVVSMGKVLSVEEIKELIVNENK